MDAMRLPLRFFATARRNGAQLRPFTEVTGLLTVGGAVTAVAVRDHLTGAEAKLAGDLVVNATGPWCERLAAMAGATVPVQPSPGVLLALVGRLCDLVVNRLHRPATGTSWCPAAPVDRWDQRLDRGGPRRPGCARGACAGDVPRGSEAGYPTDRQGGSR